MAELPFIPWYGRDFRSDTEHLGATESGAYALLLMVAWELPNCRLPDNDKRLSKWARVNSDTWAEIKDDVMAFWTNKNGHWTQARLLREWKQARKRSETARKNGKKGGRPKGSRSDKLDNPLGSSGLSQTEPAEKLITSISTSTIEDIDQSKVVSDKKNTPAVVRRFVSEDALNRVREVAPGWDRQMLLQRFTDWPPSQTARNMDAAFLGWAKKYTGGKQPGANVAHAQFTKWAAKE